jgi:hypothetical protein
MTTARKNSSEIRLGKDILYRIPVAIIFDPKILLCEQMP